MSLILSGTDGLSDVDGSAATPAIRGTDANTGIFFPAADTIAFAEGGAEVARFDSSGNFGLGVTPSAWTDYTGVLQMTGGSLAGFTGGDYLELSQNGYYASGSYKYVKTGYASKYQQNTGTHQWYVAASGSANATITYTQAMTLDSSGNLGIGETTPTAKLHIGVASAAVNGTKGVRIANPAGTTVMLECGNGGDSFVGTTSGSDFNIRTGNAVVATFLNGGNVGIGNTSPSYQLSLSKAGATYIEIKDTSGGVTSYLGASTNQLYIGNSTNHAAVFYTNNAERMRINAGAPILCLAGGSTTATGTGIAFPATQSASSDANTLDDYEEGTWTPGQNNFIISGTFSSAARYTRIGNIVNYSGWISATGSIAFSTSCLVNGFPYVGAVDMGFAVMRLADNSAAQNSNNAGAQCNSDMVNSRIFFGVFTTTAANQKLYFAGAYFI